MTRIPLADFLGGGAAVAPSPTRMRLEDFLAGGPQQPPAQPAPQGPLSSPVSDFLGQYQPPGEPNLIDWATDPANNPADPAWNAGFPPPPVQGIPAVQGVLDNWNLSGYSDPSIKRDRSGFDSLPKSALTPTAISDFNDRQRAEEQRAAQALEEETFNAFTTPFSGKSEDFHRRKKLKDDYYANLPVPISSDVRADKELFERYRRINELATGRPLLDTPYQNIQPLQASIDKTLADMKANGYNDPIRYMQETESFQGPQGFIGRKLSDLANAASNSAANVYDALRDPPGDDTFGTRIRQQEAAWREGIEDIKDERSALPNWANEVARATAQNAPQLTATAAVGLATKSPSLALATMLGPSSVEAYQVGRANGLSDGEAAGRAIALAGVEIATMKAGGAVAKSFGGKTFEEIAFGIGGKSTQKGLLNKLVETAGSSTVEGFEEGVAGVAQQFGDFVVGLEDELVGDETPEELALAFAVGFVAAGSMNGISSFSNFVDNPTAENAKAAGISEELAPTQVDRESLAAAAAARIEAMPTEAPSSPVDASPAGVTQTPELPVEVAQPAAQEVALPPQPAQPVQPDTENRKIPDSAQAPPRKRRLDDRKTASEVATLTGRTIPAPPQLRLGQGDRAAANDHRKQLQWLLDQGIAEATARGDNFNLSWMKNEKVGSLAKGNGLPQATVDSLNEYLFGETNPSWDARTGERIDSGQKLSTPPPVIPPITKPLVPPTGKESLQVAPAEPAPVADVPATSGQPTPPVAPPDAPPVAPSQVTADSGVGREVTDVSRLQESYVQAQKQPDGSYKLAYTGTSNEVFPGERFKSAWEARNYFKATRQKQRDAAASQTPATPEQVEVVAPKKKLGAKREPPPILKATEFKQKLREAATTPEEGDVLYKIVEARAEAAGESVDDYVGKRIADIMKADRVDSEYLKQLASGKGDALAQAAAADNRNINSDAFRRWAGTDNVVLDAAADRDIEVMYDGALDVYTLQDHTHGEQVGDTYATEEEAYKAANQLTRGDRFETGKPVVAKVYHGSPAADFQKFDRRKLGENTGARSAKKGFFFAGHPDTANAYNDRVQDAPEVNHEGWKFIQDNLLRGQVVGELVWRYDADVMDSESKNKPSPEKLRRWIEKHPKEIKDTAERVAKQAGYDGFGYSTKPPQDFGGGGTMPVYVRMKNPLVFDYVGGDYTDKPFSRSIQQGIDGGHDGVILMRTYDGGPIDNVFIVFDEKNIKSAIGNQGTFKERASVLAQKNSQTPKPNAEIQFLAEDGRAIIRAFREGQNLSSLLHELMHVFELDLTDDQRASLDGWLGSGKWTYNGAKPGKTKAGKWNRAAREKFARAGERYFREGKAPTPELEGVFAKLKQWLTSVYKTIKGSPIDVELSPEFKAVMDELFGGKKSFGKRKAEPAEVKAEVKPFVRRTPEEGSITRSDYERMMNDARERELALSKNKSELDAQLSRTRRSSTKLRRELQGRINELQKKINEERKVFDLNQNRLREAILEDYLEKPKSEEHRIAGMAELLRMRADSAIGPQQAIDLRNQSEALTKQLTDAATKYASEADVLNDDELRFAVEDVVRNFDVASKRELREYVGDAVSKAVSARKAMSLPELKHLSDDQKQTFRNQIEELTGKDWYQKLEQIRDAAMAENVKAKAVADEEAAKEREVQAEKKAKEEAGLMGGRRSKARTASINNRYWKELSVRSRKLKGKEGTVDVTMSLFEDPKDKTKVTGEKKEARKAEILTPELAITYTQEGDGGKKEYTLTHTPTGFAMSGGTQANLRQLAQLAIESGIDLTKLSTDAKNETNQRMGKVVRAWDNSDLGQMPDDLAAAITGSIAETPTQTKADIVLNAADLGAFGYAPLKDSTARIKEIAKAAPEFAYEPVFTVNDKKQLVFKDGVTYKLDPELFNLSPAELTEGQTVGINIEDLGIKPLTAEEVVVQSLKNWGFSNVRSDRKGGVVGSWGGAKVQLSGSGDKWTVAGDPTVNSVKNARFAIKKIHWLADGKAKAAPAVKSAESQGLESPKTINEWIDQPMPKGALGITPGNKIPARKIDDTLKGSAVASSDPDVEKQWQESKWRPTYIRKLDNAIEAVKNVGRSFTRKWIHLDPKEYGATLDMLRRAEEIPTWGRAYAANVLRKITAGLGPNKYDVFSRVLILRDLKRDVANGLYLTKDKNKYNIEDKPLPFGYTPETLKADLAKFEQIAKENPDIAEAIQRRQEFMTTLRDELVDRGLLPEQVKEYDAYFHHQVLQYMQGARFAGDGIGKRRLAPPKNSWQKKRSGSELNYNTEYLDAEFAVISQAMAQIKLQDLLKSVRKMNDLGPHLRELAGKDWRKNIPDGYQLWQPVKGSVFYRTMSISDRAMQDYLDGVVDLTEEDFREVLVRGQNKEEWVIPDELALTLDDFRPRADSITEAVASWGMNRWKKWRLVGAPFFLKYNLNNMSGDTDAAMAADPAILKYGWKTQKDLQQFHRGSALTPELSKAIELGVIGSGRLSEISRDAPTLSENQFFASLYGKNESALRRIWKAPERFTSWREDILRLSAYRRALELLNKGKDLTWATRRDAIEQMRKAEEPNEVIAARLARDLIGDYGNVSAAGTWIRSHMIPFWSWLEINSPRYYRLIRNAHREGGDVGKVAAVVGKKVLTKAAGQTAKRAIQMTLLYGAMNAWNLLVMGDLEDELSDEEQDELHIVVGRREDGSIVTIRMEGALADALSWFGLEDAPRDIAQLANGDATVSQKVIETAKAPVNRIVGGVSPIAKTAVEAATGYTLYPDVFDARPIRDPKEHLARLLIPTNVYRKFMDRPTRDGDTGGMLMGLLTRTTDPGEAAYYTARNMASEWQKESGKEASEIRPNEKANALYYHKQAIKYGDKELAERWKARYEALGGKDEGVEMSVERSSPIGFLQSKIDKADFMLSLNPDEMKVFKRANEWYQRTYTKPVRKSDEKAEAFKERQDEWVASIKDPLTPVLTEAAKVSAKKSLLGEGLPKKQLGQLASEYDKKMAEWQAGRRGATEWLKSHKDLPVVQVAVKEAWRDVPIMPKPTDSRGRIDPKFGQKRAEWNAKYGNAKQIVDSLK